MAVPFSELTEHFTEEDWQVVKIGAERLDCFGRISQSLTLS